MHSRLRTILTASLMGAVIIAAPGVSVPASALDLSSGSSSLSSQYDNSSVRQSLATSSFNQAVDRSPLLFLISGGSSFPVGFLVSIPMSLLMYNFMVDSGLYRSIRDY
ncbi:MAG: hypothetical protein Q3972_02130 [Corynebacterium sp.]|nr:hypothetical protein [Corynebacterium sp.]